MEDGINECGRQEPTWGVNPEVLKSEVLNLTA
jgi:hypothetical protein